MNLSNKRTVVLVGMVLLLFVITSVVAEIAPSSGQTSGGDQINDLKSSRLDSPTAFSWGDYDGHNLMTSVKNMSTCGAGSCAMAVASVYEARYRIAAYKGYAVIPDLDLSEQYMISCINGTCDGCPVYEVFDSLESSGVPDEACFPYVASAVPCAYCADIDSRRFRASGSGYVGGLSGASGVEAIKTEIYDNGPIMGTMDVFDGFYGYSGGVYIKTSTQYMGNIPVVIYGWGNDGGVDYWLVKNKWGASWGEIGPDGLGGWFRIRRGENECDIENRYWHLTPIYLSSESCCGEFTGGITGNANCSTDGKLTLSDITRLIDRVYISKDSLCCEAEGNTNASTDCKITLSDITVLIDAVYISRTPPATCMPECET